MDVWRITTRCGHRKRCRAGITGTGVVVVDDIDGRTGIVCVNGYDVLFIITERVCLKEQVGRYGGVALRVGHGSAVAHGLNGKKVEVVLVGQGIIRGQALQRAAFEDPVFKGAFQHPYVGRTAQHQFIGVAAGSRAQIAAVLALDIVAAAGGRNEPQDVLGGSGGTVICRAGQTVIGDTAAVVNVGGMLSGKGVVADGDNVTDAR